MSPPKQTGYRMVQLRVCWRCSLYFRIYLDIPWLLHRLVQIFLGPATGGNVFRIYRGHYSLCLFNPKGQEKDFADLCESILKDHSVSVRTLQRFAGKITSFSIAIPSAQLYVREIYRAIPGYSKSSRPIKITGTLRKELEHWHFLDTERLPPLALWEPFHRQGFYWCVQFCVGWSYPDSRQVLNSQSQSVITGQVAPVATW